jgi:dihydroorotate dehydrogenase
MSVGAPVDLGTTLAGVVLPFCAMNAAGVCATTAAEIRSLARSGTGAVVLRTTTLHPFLHPGYRSLHNPGYDRLIPLVRELAGAARAPVVASIAGATADEYATLARAFADAGAALVEADLAEPYVGAALAPFEEPERLVALLERVVPACPVPLAVKLPAPFPLPCAALAAILRAAPVRVVVLRNDFTTFEKFLLEAGSSFDVVVLGGIRSGYDVSRALAKGARAVQVDAVLRGEGPGLFARLAREMRIARGARPGSRAGGAGP